MGLRAIPHDIQGAEGGRGEAATTTKKYNHYKSKIYFRVVGQFFTDVRFWRAFLEPNPREKRVTCVVPSGMCGAIRVQNIRF
jgi:hypothetical protein